MARQIVSNILELVGNEAENPLLKTNAAAGADVVLALGCRFDFRLGSGAMIPGRA